MSTIPKHHLDKIQDVAMCDYEDDQVNAFKDGAQFGYQLADCEYWKKRCLLLDRLWDSAFGGQGDYEYDLDLYEQYQQLKSQEPR